MKTIAIVSQKGGSGKTTLALHIACAAEAAGLPTVIIDLDVQASSTGWKDTRPGDTPVVTPLPYTRLSHGLATAKSAGAKLVVIDTAPHTESPALGAIDAADLVLIPSRAGILDLRAIGSTVQLAKAKDKPAYVVLNAMPPRATQLLADATAAVGELGVKVAPVAFQQRAAFAHALTIGQTAPEYEPNGKAAEEVAEFMKWLRKAIKI